MRNLKKFLALVLAMVMAFSLMVTANAAHAGTQYNDEDTVTPAFSEAVEVLTGMGIFQGDSGSFRPASNITRAEVAAIIYRLVTGDTGNAKKDLYTTQHPFTDVRPDAWYAGYVGYLHNAKIIKGTTATTFNPTGNVTGYEVLAMILRAVGYDKNDEFTGGTWRVEVASTATNLGILQDVNSTHYGDTLHLASRRDVVASLLFRTAAYVPMVQYTLAFGYQDTGMEGGVTGSTKNPTLGWRNFGLTWDTGIVVGNQATGESRTKIGYTVESTNGRDWYFTDVSYAYAQNGADTTTGFKGKVTIEYAFNTGLDLFGHKVTAWYNGKSAPTTVDYLRDITNPDNSAVLAKFNTRYATYAVVDKATMDTVVFAENAILGANGSDTVNLLDAAQGAGFSANVRSTAYMSDRYSQFSTAELGTGTAPSKVNMYRLISNGGKDLDVAIALNQEVASINQVNTTVKDGEYIYLGTGGSQFGNALFGGGKGMILFDQLSAASVKTLGTVVTAHQIVGTTKTFSADAAANHTYTDASSIDPKHAMYQTDKLEPSMTGTIATYKQAGVANADGSFNVSAVTLTDGTVINLSGITGSLNPYNSDVYEHLINGVTKLVSSKTIAGVTYSFYKDEVGRFIGVSTTSDYSFLYTTFMDYQVGALGTGTIGYYAYGVDWDGNIVKDKQITSIKMPIDVQGTVDVKFDRTGTPVTYPSSGRTLAMGYGLAPVTLKNQGNINYGNEITEGANTRFMVDAAGNMNWYPEVGGTYGREFVGFESGVKISNSAVTPNTGIWQITSTDVVNGFARVYGAKEDWSGQNAYLLTNATKFIVVTGAGTSNLSVKIINGISELVGNGSYAEINGLAADNVYFRTNSDMYGNVDTSDNATIHTVIMSDTNLKNYGAQSLFFSEPGNTATNTWLAGADTTTDTIRQYKLYSGGQAGYYWINETVSSGDANGQAGLGDFYQLIPIDTINGQTIYRADKITDTSRNVAVGATYEYVMVNDMSTAEITFSDLPKTVFKVTGSNVTLALGDNAAAVSSIFPSGANISDIQTLNHAVSMGKAGNSGNYYAVNVAIVFSGINVVDIYVTNITQRR